MSINKKKGLSEIAKKLSRELRINQTQAEELMWKQLRNRQFLGKKFLRQHPIIYDLNGKETFYICDFYCHQLKLVIEIDGEIHNYQKKEDLERNKILKLLGLDTLRIKNEEILLSIENVFQKLQDYIKQHETNSP